MKLLLSIIMGGILPLASFADTFEIHRTAHLPTATTKRMTLKFREPPLDVFVEPDVLLDASALQSAQLQSGPRGIFVRITFNPEGAKRFAKITAENVDEELAILCDGELVSAPLVREEISGGVVDITGKFTNEKAKALVDAINRVIKK